MLILLKISNYQATFRLKSARILRNLRLNSKMEFLIKKRVRVIYSMLFVFWYFIVVVLLDKFLLHEARTNCSIYFIVFHVPVRVGQVWIMVGFFPFLSYVFPWAILRSLTNAHSHMDVIMRICANLESFVRVVMDWFIFGINLGRSYPNYF